MCKELYEYILNEETAYKTVRVPVTSNVDWNMHEHVERCTNVAFGWYHKGGNDGTRPYNDIVTPIKNVALRSEGFDVKDIVPYVDSEKYYYMSFLIKKYHPQWARKNKLDYFIDEVVESSVIYDLALIKGAKTRKPVLVKLQSIAFCDQTSILSGPIALKHHYTNAELNDFAGAWDADKIEEAIVMSTASKKVSSAGDAEAKTPGKYNEVYEIHGNLPESWLVDGGNPSKYVNQFHIVTFYTSEDGKKNGITLFKSKDKKLSDIFKAIVLNPVHGRACGKSLIETLFEPQVWNNYDGIRIKEMLDAAALILFQTDSDDFTGQKLTNLKSNTVLKHEQGKPVTRIDTRIGDIVSFTNHKTSLENNARVLGSASDAQLGNSPVSGTPFALQELVVQEGQGLHEFRQGKIASFFADELYPDWIIDNLVADMNEGKDFSEELTLDELQEIVDNVVANEIQNKIGQMILETGKVPTAQERDQMKQIRKEEFLKNGKRKFMKILQGELKKIPLKTYVNIKGKQKYMARNVDAITNVIRQVLSNPDAFAKMPGLAKPFNELLENSGLSPIEFSSIVKSPYQPEQPQALPQQDTQTQAPIN